ncbi:MAG: anion permease [Oscillospiraceae bacterium]|nr:anion permease [Oscillospiraceae bacterium]
MTAQLLSAIIFILMFILIVMEQVPRHIVTLGCGAMMLVIVFGLCLKDAAGAWEAVSLGSIVAPDFWYSAAGSSHSTGVNWETIFFIFGMMVMVEGMAESGFFRWLCIAIAKLVQFRIRSIFIMFMIISAVLAMFIDSITVIMFLAAVTVELSRMLKFNPVTMILAEIFCANLGGSATMCGDPPNIIIGTSLGYTFADFISNTGLIALVSMAVMLVFFYFALIRKMPAGAHGSSCCPAPRSVIKSARSFAVSIIIFLLAVVLLITHARTGLTVSTIGILIAALTLLFAGKNRWHILKCVDYKTLLFFVGLFIVVSGLEHTGILAWLAGLISTASGGNLHIMIAIILWGSAVASAFIDNIPFAATMIPVIKTLAATSGVELPTLAWALAMGTDVGGSATPIGASANVVGVAIASKNGYHIGWGKYCRILAVPTVIVIAISMILLFFRYL